MSMPNLICFFLESNEMNELMKQWRSAMFENNVPIGVMHGSPSFFIINYMVPHLTMKAMSFILKQLIIVVLIYLMPIPTIHIYLHIS